MTLRDRYSSFFEAVNSEFGPEEIARIENAFNEAVVALEGMTRYDGTPLSGHTVNTARIVVSEIGMGSNSAIATLLHDAVRMGLVDIGDVRMKYGAATADIIKSLSLISKVRTKVSDKQADNFRDLIISYADDPRVILIKLADRLEVMRSLAMFPEEKRKKKSWESMNLYAGIAHKLGLYSIKSELEDISLSWLEPDDYLHIKNKLEESASERDKLIAEFTAPIKKKLDVQGIKYSIKGRTKSIYSIWRKMKKFNIPFEEVFDLFAVRIIIDCPQEEEKRLCWSVFSIVTDFYTPNPDRMRDWISIPKSNGYESLHATVVTPKGNWVEVQIRSERMDEIAERGIAAHWRYKGVNGSGKGYEDWLARLREMLEASDKDMGVRMELDKKPSSGEIFVFTPKGDLRKLPEGAAVLDFAFDIHSDVGCACTGARINGRNVPIKEPLKNGDIVNIITSKNQKPKTDWLAFAATNKARHRIKACLREEEMKIAGLGREDLERKIRNWKLGLTIDDAINVLSKHYKKPGTEVYAGISEGKIGFADIKDIISRYLSGDDIAEGKARPALPQTKQGGNAPIEEDALVIDDSIKSMHYKFGKCCNPVFGDKIFGFTTVNSGITIHRNGCPNAKRLKERYPYRVMEAKWRSSAKQSGFIASLHVVAEDSTGMVNRITDVITNDLKVNIRSVRLSPMRNNRIGGTIEIEVPNSGVVDAVAFRLLRIKGVEKAYRVSV